MTGLFVRKIWQKNKHTFAIQWNDGHVQDFRLAALQRTCPCARCVDEFTGKRLLDPKTVTDNVRAVVIRSIGRYGLKVQFTSGCSMGIYTFDKLREMQSGNHE